MNETMEQSVTVETAKELGLLPAEFDIMFAHGISREGDIVDLGGGMGIVKKTGAFFSFSDTRLGQGRENAKAFLKEHGDVAAQIEEQVRAKGVSVGSPFSSCDDEGSEG